MPSTEEYYPDGVTAGPLSYIARVRNFMAWVGQALELMEWDLRIASGYKLIFGESAETGAAIRFDSVEGELACDSAGDTVFRTGGNEGFRLRDQGAYRELRLPSGQLLVWGSGQQASAWHDGAFNLRNHSGQFKLYNDAPGQDLYLGVRNYGDTASYPALIIKAGANVYPMGFFNDVLRWRLANQGPVSYIGTADHALGNSELGWKLDGAGNLVAQAKDAGGVARTYTLTPNP